MDWIMILTMLMEMLQKCQENRTPEAIEAGLNNPGIRERLALRAAIKEKLGLRGSALREKVAEGMDELRGIGPEGVSDLMAEVAARVGDGE